MPLLKPLLIAFPISLVLWAAIVAGVLAAIGRLP
jgi:hypothetical protein